jgi:hypothetical protein
MDVIYACNVRDIPDVGHVSDVGNIDDAQVIAAVVIPGKKRLSRSQREPAYQTHPNCYREARTSEECN